MSVASADWENQRAFLAVLREGSLSAAARTLGVAQPTVRRRLEALERSLGHVLFTRSPSGLSPTNAARELEPHAEAMAAAAAAFTRASSAKAAAVAGTVRITASEIVGCEILPDLLATLRERHPKLRFEVDLSNQLKDLLRQEADIAVRMVRPTQVALHAKRVGTVKLGLFATKSFLERNGPPKAMADLASCGFVGRDRSAADQRIRAGLAGAISAAEFALRTDNHMAQLAAIRAGIGVGFCQVPLAARSPGLVRVLETSFDVGLETWVVMHEDLRRVRRVRVTFDHLVAGLTVYCAGGSLEKLRNAP
jgi:DNA-binding transcriptional LysR family regulator